MNLTDRARTLRHQMTDAERHLWFALRDRRLHGWRFRRQHVVAGYIADFACPDAWLIVELDGGQHTAEVDAARTRELEAAGYRVLRFWNNEVLRQTEAVLARIAEVLETPPAPRSIGSIQRSRTRRT